MSHFSSTDFLYVSRSYDVLRLVAQFEKKKKKSKTKRETATEPICITSLIKRSEQQYLQACIYLCEGCEQCRCYC